MLLPLTVRGERFFNVWEASYGLGTPGPTASWLNYTSEIGPGVAMHNTKLTIGHQYQAEDFGEARKGLYYPTIGFSLSYLDYTHCHLTGKHNYSDWRYDFGRFLALSWHHSQYYLAKDDFRLKTSWDMGFAYAFHHHDENLPNLLFPMGGRMMVYIEMGVQAGFQTSCTEWSIGPHFIHMSNSNTHEPNSGANNLGVNLSIKPACHKTHDVLPQQAAGTNWSRRWYLDAMYSLGLTRTDTEPETLYQQSTIALSALWQYNQQSAIGAGLEATYLPIGDRNGRKTYAGLSFVHTTWIRNWALHGQVGCYLNGKHPKMGYETSRIYERFGFRYHPYQPKAGRKFSPYIAIYSKGDGFIAQELELCIGSCVF